MVELRGIHRGFILGVAVTDGSLALSDAMPSDIALQITNYEA